MTAPVASPYLAAAEPPEDRGLARDEVRLLVAAPDGTRLTVFRDLARFLEPGDLVVVNDSATLPAALDGRRQDGRLVTVHLSTPLPHGERAGREWLVELRDTGRVGDGAAGERLSLPGGAGLTLLAGYPDGAAYGSRLWRAELAAGPLLPYLRQHGRAISYTAGRWPLEAYQTVFGRTPADALSGSSEMPSAGRPFSFRVLRDLRARGVGVAAITLHTGVSSLEAGELPLPERYRVPDATARQVNRTRHTGGRVVAVGTTTTRALESAVDPGGVVQAADGVTDLVVDGRRPARVVDALLTGWHDPDASHLLLLEAVAGADLVRQAYTTASGAGLLWHEFGDSCLLMASRRPR